MNDLTNEVEARDLDAITEAEVAKAVQEVQAALIIAKRFPRNEDQALERILKACKRRSLAEVAIYALPRGGQKISGPSIRLAETLAKAWGNLDFGIQEIDHNDDYTTFEAYCWDLETNVKRRRRMSIPHKIKLRTGATKHITDPKEITEMIGSFGQRQVRQCILSVIPGDVVEAALQQVHATLEAPEATPVSSRTAKTLAAFKEFNIGQEQIERRYACSIDRLSSENYKELQEIYVSLKEAVTLRSDWFGDVKAVEEGTKADSLNAKFAPK